MVLGTRDLKHWVLRPSGRGLALVPDASAAGCAGFGALLRGEGLNVSRLVSALSVLNL